MVLAAGRGSRMRELSDTVPKPLMRIGGETLIDIHLKKLKEVGFTRVVINVAYKAQQIISHVKTNPIAGLEIVFSEEASALETAGGIANALSLINSPIFPVVNADIFSDYDYANFFIHANTLSSSTQYAAHIILVDNPEHNCNGDFRFESGKLASSGISLTFSGIGLYRSSIFKKEHVLTKGRLGTVLRELSASDKVSAEHHRGFWSDIGTPERLDEINKYVKENL
jgi:MurNAc alpha-1-phosphate uridylyltransferase